jgi:hypothetical protein
VDFGKEMYMYLFTEFLTVVLDISKGSCRRKNRDLKTTILSYVFLGRYVFLVQLSIHLPHGSTGIANCYIVKTCTWLKQMCAI